MAPPSCFASFFASICGGGDGSFVPKNFDPSSKSDIPSASVQQESISSARLGISTSRRMLGKLADLTQKIPVVGRTTLLDAAPVTTAMESIAGISKNIPVVGTTARVVAQGLRGTDNFVQGVTDSVVSQVPLFRRLEGGPDLSGLAYVCAMVSTIAYDDYDKRTASFSDKEGNVWHNIDFKNGKACPETPNHFVVYGLDDTAVIGFRGSVDFVDDWLISDGGLFLTSLPPVRCDAAEKFLREFRDNYSYSSLVLTGHSLGGTIASYVGLATNREVHCYNPGAGPLDPIVKRVKDLLKDGGVTVNIHRIYSDVVSAFAADLDGRIKIYNYNQTKPGLAHSIDQFF